jgi:hypothetical protein
MSSEMIRIEIQSGDGGTIEKKLLNIAGLTLFSDLLAVCLNDLKDSNIIVDQEQRTISVIGTSLGGWDKISAIVDENYSLADICFNQGLFSGKPTVHIRFELHRLQFYFMESSHANYDCSLRYLCGSKKLGEAFLNDIHISKEKLHWKQKLNETYYSERLEGGLQSRKFGLSTDFCVVFIVNPLVNFKKDIISFMDSVGLLQNTALCKMAILFRDAEYLKTSLQMHFSEPLKKGDVYLLLVKSQQRRSSQSDGSKHTSSTSMPSA